MALILLFGLSAYAQHEHHGPRHEKGEQFTPEQRATLQAKKLSLALDLTSVQQEKVQEIFLAREKERISRQEALDQSDSLSRGPESRFKRMNRSLDAMIAHKQQMKNVLTAEQYVKWEKITAHNGHRSRHHKGRKGHRGDRRG